MNKLPAALLASLLPAALIALLATDARATRLRRPFAESKTFNYGFDNNGASSGCTDYNCGDRCYDGHTGTDYALVLGTNVLAPADGTVVATNDGCANYGSLGNTCGGSCGNYVKLQLPDGHFILFCHLQLGSLLVSTGDHVTCGQQVGKSASSGNSSGPHLHMAWRNSGNTGMNPYAGACSSSAGAWVDQGGYWDPTGAQCECVTGTEVCNGQDDDCDGQSDEDEVCEREALLRGQSWVAPARTTDIDGDGRADVCGRGAAGMWCHLSQGSSWSAKGPVLSISDANGWNDASNWGTIRMGDIDGDGRADLCARANGAVVCWKSDGTSLATQIDGPGWSDAGGWAAFQYHSTLRLADIDADGKDDLCARAAKGVVCVKSSGSSFGPAIDGPAWSDAAGLNMARYYGTLRTGDVDGDHKIDLCMRTKDGMECWLSDGNGFPTRVQGPAWSDTQGWAGFPYWSTIRLADVNGDGRADLCARAAAGLRCHFSEGQTFGDAVTVAALSDSSGWNDPSNFLSLRVGDIDGDRAQDLCLRANAGMLCYRWNGSSFDQVDGPAFSDADGWNKPEYLHTIQLGDMNQDGKADLCGRHVDGWRCHPSTGSGFGPAIALDEFTDAGGWAAERYYATIMFGGPACIAHEETCNGEDDDCDGEVDEGACLPEGGAGGSSGAAGTAGAGAGGGAAAGSAGSAGAGVGLGGASNVDSGNSAGSSGKGTETWGESSSDDAGCGCRTTASDPAAGWLALLLLPLVGWRRRQ